MTPLSPAAFEALFNSAPHLAILLSAADPALPVLAISDSFLAVNGKSREAVIGQGFFEVFGDPAYQAILDAFQTSVDSVLATGQSHRIPQFAFHLHREDGSTATRYWNFETHLLHLPETDGTTQPVIYHTVVDVTDQIITQQLQTNLLETSELQKLQVLEESQSLKDLIDSSRVSAYTLVPEQDVAGAVTDFRIKAMTPQFRKTMITMAHPDADRFRVSELYTDFKQGPSFRHYCDTLLQGNANTFDLFHPEGPSGKWWHKTVTRLSPTEILVTLIDQTEIKQVQLQLEQTIETLQRSNTNLEEFAYAASHDLQEPLRKIQTFCTMLHSRMGDAPDTQSVALLARMQSAAGRMRMLIEDLLQYSRLPLGSSSFETVCLKETIEDVLAKMTDELAASGGRVDLSGLVPIWGDTAQLQLLFRNLLDNALKFAHPDRPLQVRVQGQLVTPAEAGLMPVPGSLSRAYLRVDFADNGIGFEQQYAERMFQIFQRLHGRSEATGTGVGLSMVQKIIHNHHGRIVANGVPEAGATFTFWLPLAADPTPCE